MIRKWIQFLLGLIIILFGLARDVLNLIGDVREGQYWLELAKNVGWLQILESGYFRSALVLIGIILMFLAFKGRMIAIWWQKTSKRWSRKAKTSLTQDESSSSSPSVSVSSENQKGGITAGIMNVSPKTIHKEKAKE